MKAAQKVSVFGVIQSECGKMQTTITPNTDTFYAVEIVKYITNTKCFKNVTFKPLLL